MKMKIKHTHLLLMLFVLILSVATVNAADTDSDDTDKKMAESDADSEAVNQIIKKNNQITKTSPTTTKTKVDVEADKIAVEYNKTKYLTIELEDRYDNPIKNTKINAKVISKTKNQTYSLTSNKYGIAKLNTKNLCMGNHKVIITSGSNKYLINKQTSIFVGKKETVTLKLNTEKTLDNNDKIKLVTKRDEEDTEVSVAYVGVPKYTQIIKAKFYFKNKNTGKIYTKIDSAEFDDGRWELPNEDYNRQRYTLTKVEVDYLTSKTTKTTTTINKSQNNTNKITSTTQKVKAHVEADEVAVEYKKNNYLTIKLENNKDQVIKNTKINVKVYTGNKTKTFTLTTNNRGIAKLNTNNLSLGNHKVIITSNNEKYLINKQTNIFVGKKETVTISSVNSQKILKNKDSIKIVTKKINNYKNEVNVTYSGVPKYTKIINAKFYYKNKNTGKIYIETDSVEFDDGRWELPNEDYNRQKYTLTKVEVDYVTSK